MIVLDTNVISELMRPSPAAAVVAWLSGRDRASLHVTSFSCAEILFGLALMPASRRRDALREQAIQLFDQDFAGRVLSFDAAAAARYAAIAARRRLAGKPIAAIDGMIAAIVQVRGASLATRDRDLSGCEINLINPWLDD